MNRAIIYKREIYIIIILLLAAAGLYYFFNAHRRGGDVYARIIFGGKTVQTVELTENRVLSLKDNPRICFEVRNGAVAFVESDCPDKICVRTGFISRPGQMAVCLPNRVSLVIVGEPAPDEPDAVAY